MITFDHARRLMLRHVADDEAEFGKAAERRKDLSDRERQVLGLGARDDNAIELVILDDQTIEGEFGWVFFYQSRVYLESGDVSYALAGNAPILVSRQDGSLHVTGTSQPIEAYIENFERSGSPHR